MSAYKRDLTLSNVVGLTETDNWEAHFKDCDLVVEAVLALLCVPLVWRLGVEHAARVRALDNDEGRAMLAAPLLPSARNGRKLVFY